MTQIAFDTTGAVKKSTQEELAAADETTVILGYVDGILSDGRPYYAYLAIKPSKYEEFHRKTAAREALRVEEYGSVIAFGYETAPPPEVVQKMRDEYGFDDNYGAELQKDAQKQKKVFLDKQEADRLKNIVAMLQGTKK